MMKRLIPVLLAVSALQFGCAPDEPDALPDDPMRVLETRQTAPVPSESMAERSGQSQAHLDRGREVFLAKCIQCHEPRIAVSPEDPSWHPTMRGMAWNADLSAADELALIDYLRVAARE